MVARTLVTLATLAAVVSAPVVSAEDFALDLGGIDVSAPTTYLETEGIVWSERQNVVHLQWNVALQPTICFLTTSIATNVIDLEVRGLPSSVTDGAILELTPAVASFTSVLVGKAISFQNEAILWNIPKTPGQYDLTHLGATIGEVTLVNAPTLDQLRLCGKPDASESGKSGNAPAQSSSTTSEQGDGWVLLQAAASRSNDATVKVTQCYEHKLTVSAKVEGGGAAGAKGSAGASLTVTKRKCTAVTSTGSPTKEEFKIRVQMDTYSDGSKKAYGIKAVDDYSVAAWGAAANCKSGTDACFSKITLQDGKEYEEELTESIGLTVSISFGWSSPVLSVTGSISIEVKSESKHTIHIVPPDNGVHEYYIASLRGSAGKLTGLITFVQEDPRCSVANCGH